MSALFYCVHLLISMEVEVVIEMIEAKTTWRGSPPLMVRSESLVSLATLLEQNANALHV